MPPTSSSSLSARAASLLRVLLESRWIRIGFALVAVVFFVATLANSWSKVSDTLRHISVLTLVIGFVSVLAGLVGSMLAYRALLADLGSALPVGTAARIFFVGQLGKYIPGSLWPVVAQMEMGRQAGVPRQRSASAIALTILIYLGAGLFVGALSLPFADAKAAGYSWVVLVGLAILAGLHPRLLNPVIARLLALTGRPPLEHPVSLRGVGAALGWSVVSWALFGVHVYLLARNLGADGWRTVPLAIGGFALAWSVGFLAVFAPAGLGVRDVALYAVLGPVLTQSQAYAVAGLSRVLMSVGDVVTAGIAALLWRRGRTSSGAADPVVKEL